ncbi:hypothetical protein [Mastigocladopsis repens]|uniref:hypothetical protein n=1 Tax=Mastigocladopsis repens TaxID=221287 RepID=UPI0002F70BD0|nr:hypothetical protein [Mastigocladopsis repens]
MRLKRWESPRREGRNDKGKGGSARQRQLKKQQQMLRKKLKEGNNPDSTKPNNSNKEKPGGRKFNLPPYFFLLSQAKAKSVIAHHTVYESYMKSVACFIKQSFEAFY